MDSADKKNQNTISNFEYEIDLGQMLRLILMQSKLVILIIILGTAIGLGSYFSSERIYKITSLLQSYNTQTASITAEVLGNYANNNKTAISDFRLIYKSRSNLLDVIENNALNIKVKGGDKETHDLIKLFFYKEKIQDVQRFYLKFNDDEYELKDKDKNTISTYPYGKFSNNNFDLQITKPPTRIELELEIIYYPRNKSFTINKDKFSLKTNETRYYGVESDLFEVSYETNNPKKGIDVLNYANDVFISNNIKTESEEARKALNFIEMNIERVKSDLDSDKENLKNFQESNKSVNVDLEINSIIETIANIEKQVSEIDLELAKASNSFTQSNPIYLQLVQQKEELLKQRELIETRIKKLPLAQQQYIDLSKQLEMSQEVYEQLLNKQLEYSIREASTLGNIRVVDSAYLVDKIYPTISMLFIYTFLSLLLGIVVALVRGYYLMPISNPAEIEDRNIDLKINGVIPLMNSSKDIFDDKESERIMQSFQSLIVNINNMLEGKAANGTAKKILFTSPTAKNGKSTISQILAQRISELNKKVLLIDGDWKRGDLHKAFNKEKITVSTFNNIDPANFEDPKYKVTDNLYLLPKVSGANNSFHYIYSPKFKLFLDKAEKLFDYIIIDTAPLLSVSDTAILMAQADANFTIIRHGYTKINELKQVIGIANQLGTKLDGAIYNCYEKPSSYYGYYGLYGNYSYQYYANKYLYNSYDYESDSEN